MEKTIKIIIAMVILVILIIITTIILLQINKTEVQKEEDNPETVAFSDVEVVTNKNLFYQIEYNINTYYQYLYSNNKNAINAISPKNAVQLKNNNESSFKAQEMYVLDKISNITTYVYGITRNKGNQDEYYIIINMDYINNTYSIINSTKEEFENAKNNKVNIQYKEDISISKNAYNKIQEKNMTDFEMLQYYFEDYKYKAIYAKEEAFKLIDSGYKQKKFGNSIEKYKEYINANIDRLIDANIVKHGVKKEGQFGTYTAYDTYNNYYKIKELGINQYTIILDNFTLETDELSEKYNKLSDKEKVTSNIDKIIKLINEKSYEEVYGYLNQNFKNTYFKTEKDFEKYIQENFFENNIVGAISLEIEGDVYIATIPYKESLSSAADEKIITINMRTR